MGVARLCSPAASRGRSVRDHFFSRVFGASANVAETAAGVASRPAAVPRLRPPSPSVRLGVCPSSELPQQHRPASRGAARAPRTCTQALPGLPRASAGGAAVSAALLVWWGHRPGPRRSWPFRGSCLETRDCGLPSPVPRCARSRPVMAPSSGLTSRVVICNRRTCG